MISEPLNMTTRIIITKSNRSSLVITFWGDWPIYRYVVRLSIASFFQMKFSAFPGASRAPRDIRDVDYIFSFFHAMSRLKNYLWLESVNWVISVTGTAWLHDSGTMGPFFLFVFSFALFRDRGSLEWHGKGGSKKDSRRERAGLTTPLNFTKILVSCSISLFGNSLPFLVSSFSTAFRAPLRRAPDLHNKSKNVYFWWWWYKLSWYWRSSLHLVIVYVLIVSIRSVCIFLEPLVNEYLIGAATSL